MNSRKIINLCALEDSFQKIVTSDSWKNAEQLFASSKHILLLGNGGNLAVADHAAIDISKLTNKCAEAPGSGITVSSLANDFGHDNWLSKWVEVKLRSTQVVHCLVIGISSSGQSDNVFAALKLAKKSGANTLLISAQPTAAFIADENIYLNTAYYHAGEALTLLLTYQLTEAAGFTCPKISTLQQSATPTIEQLSEQYNDQENHRIAIDFDGVIHNDYNGFGNGLITGPPIKGVHAALKQLAVQFELVIFTSKALPDRPLINGKSGAQLVWQWLQLHELDSYITIVTSTKPRAKYYVDDKAIHFTDWDNVLTIIGNQ